MTHSTVLEFQNDISFVLGSLTNSAELSRKFAEGLRFRVDGTTRLGILLRIEKIRIEIRQLFGYSQTNFDFLAIDEVRKELLDFLMEFAATGFGAPEFLLSAFRPLMRGFEAGDKSNLRAIMASIRLKNVGVALQLFIEYFSNLYIDESDLAEEQRNSDRAAKALGRLRKLVPEQQVAPAQFRISGERIVLVDQKMIADEGDLQNASSAFDHLKNAGDQLIDSLSSSNCDPRLISNVRDLHSRLVANDNAITIGLANMASNTMCDQFRPELPDAIASMFKSYTSGISHYLAQFPDWQKFTQNAAEIELADIDISTLKHGVDDILNVIAANPELAEPEVPKTLQLISEFLKNPKLSARRSAYALIKTVENLASAIYSYAVALISKTAEKSIDDLSGASAKILVGMLLVAVAGGTGVGVAAAAAGIPWVQQAGELAKTLIEQATIK